MSTSLFRDSYGCIPTLLKEWPSLVDEFARVANGETGGKTARLSLPTDVQEYQDRYEILVDVPGVHKEAINIEFEDGVLTLEVNFGEADEGEGGQVLHNGRRTGKFEQELKLSDAADEVAASLKDGVLALVITKKAEKQPRKIQIG